MKKHYMDYFSNSFEIAEPSPKSLLNEGVAESLISEWLTFSETSQKVLFSILGIEDKEKIRLSRSPSTPRNGTGTNCDLVIDTPTHHCFIEIKWEKMRMQPIQCHMYAPHYLQNYFFLRYIDRQNNTNLADIYSKKKWLMCFICQNNELDNAKIMIKKTLPNDCKVTYERSKASDGQKISYIVEVKEDLFSFHKPECSNGVLSRRGFWKEAIGETKKFHIQLKMVSYTEIKKAFEINAVEPKLGSRLNQLMWENF